MEYYEVIEDLEYEQLVQAMEDGLEDTWLNLPTRTISKYLNQKILEELDELDQLSKNPSSPGLQKLIDDRIARRSNA